MLTRHPLRRLRRPRRVERAAARAALPARPRGAEDGGARAGDVLAIAAPTVLVILGAANLLAMGDARAAVVKLVIGGVGLVGLVGLRALRTPITARLAWWGYGTSLALLVVVLAVGRTVNASVRWLEVGPLTLQPSELAKPAVVLALAATFTPAAPGLGRFARGAVLVVVPVVLVALEPDLSTAALLALVGTAVLVTARVPARHLVPVLAAALVAAPLALGLLHAYQLERLGTFLAGNQAVSGPGWAAHQAAIAIAGGGWFGGHDDPLHGLAARYLPEGDTDLAAASLVSGWGLVAGLAALAAVVVIAWRAVLAAADPRTRTGALFCAGFAVLVVTEATVSVGGTLGLLPMAGIPFPILSAGGSSTVVHLLALGLVLGGRRDGRRRRLWSPTRVGNPRPRLARTAVAGATALLAALCAVGGGSVLGAAPRLAAAREAQMTRCVPLPAPRGRILDRSGAVLAADAGTDRVSVVPGLARRDPAVLDHLAALLAAPAAALHARVDPAPVTGRAVDLGEVDGATGDAVAGAALPGVVVAAAPRRAYPTGPVAAPVLGFVGRATPTETARADDLDVNGWVGRAGLEAQYDAVLRGVDGEQCAWVDPVGVAVAPGPRRPPTAGTDLRLSLDLGVQRRLVADLAGALRGSPAGSVGGGVVLDPRTGAVLALASLPAADDTAYGPPVDRAALTAAASAPGRPTLDHAVASAVPPGSTFKLVVAAAGLVHPVIPPDAVIPTGGEYTLGGHTFHNWRVLPPQDLRQAIAWSNDVYFYKLATALGPDALIDTARAFGVGAPTGVDLPGESGGHLGTPASVTAAGGTWYPGSTVILGIGQGPLTVTPLQDARWTAAVATGRLVTPRLGAAVATGDGTFRPLDAPAPRPLPFADRLGPVRDGMRAMVTSGTGRSLDGLGISVGAKSGTAQDPSVPGGGVDDWMTAAAPFDGDPRSPAVVVTAWVQRPDTGTSRTAAVVADLLRATPEAR